MTNEINLNNTTVVETTDLLSALILARSEMPILKSDSSYTRGSTKINYNDVNSILGIVVPVLLKHGLFLSFRMYVDNLNNQILETMIAHKITGGEITSKVIVPKMDRDQDFGATLTYRKRYALVALLALPEDKDDDGQSQAAAVDNKSSQPVRLPSEQKKTDFSTKKWAVGDKISDKQVNMLNQRLKYAPPTLGADIMRIHGAFMNIDKNDFQAILEAIDNKQPSMTAPVKQEGPTEVTVDMFEEVDDLPF